MYREDIQFVTAATLHQIIDQLSRWDRADWRPDDERESWLPYDDTHQKVRASQAWVATALKFVAVSAAGLDEPAFLGPMLGLLRQIVPQVDLGGEDIYHIRQAIDSMMGQTETPLHFFELLVNIGESSFASLACERLDPSKPDHAKLLRRLAAHPDQSVRSSAHKRLVAHDPNQWWRGIFRSNPLGRIPEEAADAAGAALGELRKFMEQPYEHRIGRDLDAFIAALDALPDHVAVEAAELAVLDARLLGHDGGTPLVRLLLERGGPEAAARFLKRAETQAYPYQIDTSLQSGIETLVEAERLPICQRLIDYAVANQAVDRVHTRDSADIAARIACKNWPADQPITPILRRIEDLHETDYSPIASTFLYITSTHTPSMEDWEYLVSKFSGARTGGWIGLGSNLRSVVEKAPLSLREPLLRRSLIDGDDSQARWALEQLMGEKECAATPISEVLRDARTRQLFFSSATLLKTYLPRVRPLLLDGSLDWLTTHKIMGAIGTNHGGMISGPQDLFLNTINRNSTLFSNLLSARENQDTDPPNEEEWAAFRRQRAAQTRDADFWHAVLWILPDGEWAESDQKLVDDAHANLLTQPSARKAMALASAYYSRQDPELIGRMEEVVEIASKVDERIAAQATKATLYRLREDLGLLDEPDDEDAQTARKLDWMDQPD